MCRRWYLKSRDKNSFKLWRVRHYPSFSLSFGADWVSIHWLPTNVEKFWCPTHGKAQERKLPYGLGYLWNCREAFHRLIARWALIITFHLIKTFDLHIFWGINLHFRAVVRFSNLRGLCISLSVLFSETSMHIIKCSLKIGFECTFKQGNRNQKQRIHWLQESGRH